MSLGLTNAKISGHSAGRLKIQKVTPARTSIAEDAKFIPKPHKRVSFKLSSGSTTLGSGSTIGGNLKKGGLGSSGISANTQRVRMEIDITPEKDFTVIATQEEGRQTNNAQTTHFSQQYDSYGRPRIGFSREPYDFAATKYMAITSEIKFRENMEATIEGYNSYLADPMNEEVDLQAEDVNILGPEGLINKDVQGKNVQDLELIVANASAKKGMINIDEKKETSHEIELLGSGNSEEPGMVEAKSDENVVAEKPGAEVEAASRVETGQTVEEVAAKLGIDIKNIMNPAKVSELANAHNFTDVGRPASISVSA